jgi:hypothetical protein
MGPGGGPAVLGPKRREGWSAQSVLRGVVGGRGGIFVPTLNTSGVGSSAVEERQSGP